jgi:hypothetical protein
VQQAHLLQRPHHNDASSEFLQRCVRLFACICLVSREIFVRLQSRVPAVFAPSRRHVLQPSPRALSSSSQCHVEAAHVSLQRSAFDTSYTPLSALSSFFLEFLLLNFALSYLIVHPGFPNSRRRLEYSLRIEFVALLQRQRSALLLFLFFGVESGA